MSTNVTTLLTCPFSLYGHNAFACFIPGATGAARVASGILATPFVIWVTPLFEFGSFVRMADASSWDI